VFDAIVLVPDLGGGACGRRGLVGWLAAWEGGVGHVGYGMCVLCCAGLASAAWGRFVCAFLVGTWLLVWLCGWRRCSGGRDKVVVGRGCE
jgi:hypothetical protein